MAKIHYLQVGLGKKQHRNENLMRIFYNFPRPVYNKCISPIPNTKAFA